MVDFVVHRLLQYIGNTWQLWGKGLRVNCKEQAEHEFCRPFQQINQHNNAANVNTYDVLFSASCRLYALQINTLFVAWMRLAGPRHVRLLSQHYEIYEVKKLPSRHIRLYQHISLTFNLWNGIMTTWLRIVQYRDIVASSGNGKHHCEM